MSEKDDLKPIPKNVTLTDEVSATIDKFFKKQNADMLKPKYQKASFCTCDCRIKDPVKPCDCGCHIIER